MSKSDIVILCAGRINYSNLPIHAGTSNSMLPVNGKPVISWILDDLLEKQTQACVHVVVREEDQWIQNFVSHVYGTRLQIKLVSVVNSPSILHSLKAGLQAVQSDGVTVILGDTLIKDWSADAEPDYVYVKEVEDSSRWCLAVFDSQMKIDHYIEKSAGIEAPCFAVCGYYCFSDVSFLIAQVLQAIEAKKEQLSNVLVRYQSKYPLLARPALEWFDFGNPDNFIKAKQELLQSRFFNSLTIDPVLNTITKVSDLDQKLRSELNWYESLPDKLKILTPRIVSKEEVNGKLVLTQEYYGYPTLAELFLYSNLNAESWESIFKTLFRIQDKFKDYKGDLSQSELSDMYLGKTLQRLSDIQNHDREWHRLLHADHLIINGRQTPGWPAYEGWLQTRVLELLNHPEICIVHGDFCFGNILFDIHSHIVRLIDPRGSFGREGIFGDPRYDVAKLRHSVVGKYDYIVNDLFQLEQRGISFDFVTFFSEERVPVVTLFDDIVKRSGYDLQDIKLIEALLFLSMIPYHRGRVNRQKAMFLTGLMRLNEIM